MNDDSITTDLLNFISVLCIKPYICPVSSELSFYDVSFESAVVFFV